MPARLPPRGRPAGFTLIELLIVIAIISILAAIALPNFLEAQTRAKYSRALADMRSVGMALEAYFVDNNAYPRGRPKDDPAHGGGGPVENIVPLSARLKPLTTPIAFISSVPPDVFPAMAGNNGAYPLWQVDTFDYFDDASDFDEDQHALDSTRGAMWRLASAGPDLWASFGMIYPVLTGDLRNGYDYDPTNGSVSAGDVVRLGAPVREFKQYP